MSDRQAADERRTRACEFGIRTGIFAPGRWNAVTDVAGVLVGHLTVVEGTDVRTGATAVVPHAGNLLTDRVPAGLAVANGHGKLMGATQIVELGEIETPIVLTNTLSVPQAAEAILDWTLARDENREAVSINPVVGETNDGTLNAIHRRTLTAAQIRRAIDEANDGPVAGGCVGAGTGTTAFGWKAGIGTSSRRLPRGLGGFTVGVLVQANFAGVLQILGVPIGRLLRRHHLADAVDDGAQHGSIMIIVATDAPLLDRNLTRLARRSFAGLARTGASFANGSGDYAIAFSTAESVRSTPERRGGVTAVGELGNDAVSGLFQAVIEATEEAIYDALFLAEAMTGRNGTTVDALPLDRVVPILRERDALEPGPPGNTA